MTETELYTHSGKFELTPIFFGFLLSAAAGIVVGYAYAYGVYYVPHVLLNIVMAVAFGYALSRANLWTLRMAKVRSLGAFTAASWTASFLAFYFSWAVWIGIILRQADVDVGGLEVALHPSLLAEAVISINRIGAWTLFDFEVNGLLLLAVWLAEAAIVFGMGVALARKDFLDLPFCETCQTWCVKETNVARIGDDPETVAAAVRRKDFATLEFLERVDVTSPAGVWCEFDLEICPKCKGTRTADLSLVVAKESSKGDVDRDVRKLIENIPLTEQEEMAIRALRSEAFLGATTEQAQAAL